VSRIGNEIIPRTSRTSSPDAPAQTDPAATGHAALAYGVAHGALAMTTPGDVSMATLPEVEHLMAGRSARVVR
jgi:2-dehydro-3-deoxygluconokinase